METKWRQFSLRWFLDKKGVSMHDSLIRLIAALTILYFHQGCGSNGSGEELTPSNDACSVIGLPTKVVGGSACGNLQTAPVVRVLQRVRDKAGERYLVVCTGTLISTKHVLTAAHCFLDQVSQPYEIIGGAIGLGEIRSLEIIPAESIQKHPDFSLQDGRLLKNDAAILTLSKNVSVAPLSIFASEQVDEGDLASVFGYGQRQIGDEVSTSANDPNQLISGQMRISSVSSSHIFVEYDGQGVNVCFGDSGGPLIIAQSGKMGIAGVVSASTRRDCNVGDVTAFTNLTNEDLLSWIIRIAPDASLV